MDITLVKREMVKRQTIFDKSSCSKIVKHLANHNKLTIPLILRKLSNGSGIQPQKVVEINVMV
jgi:histone deacetylase complex regulatory component SIN3